MISDQNSEKAEILPSHMVEIVGSSNLPALQVEPNLGLKVHFNSQT